MLWLDWQSIYQSEGRVGEAGGLTEKGKGVKSGRMEITTMGTICKARSMAKALSTIQMALATAENGKTIRWKAKELILTQRRRTYTLEHGRPV